MSGDLLDGARAKRLLRREGRWFLEVERLVAVDPGVFRPTLQRIEGREGILWFLGHHNSDADLERSARGVFDTTSGAHATYESAKGTWVPSSTSARHFRDQARKRRAEVETYWRQQNELARLRVENEELKRRLAKLERILYSPGNLELKLRGSESPPELNPQFPPQASTPKEAAASAGEQVAGQSAGGGAPDGSDGEPSEAAQAAAEAAQAAEAAEAEPVAPAEPASIPPPPPDFEPFEVPPPSAFEQCIATLVGSDVELEPPDGSAHDLAEFFSARLVSDDDELRGVMLADLEAVARMGGSLLMLPEPEVLQQISSGTPSQDSLEAMSEVFNTLTAEFNNVEGNPHVRSRPLGPVDPEDVKWFKYARNRVEFKMPEGGLLVMLAR
ncbi:MAG: hypothetical protein H6716_05470 [Polyangiaceae bacterium]|nr:hypothetical protein [Polyangiaceae bacterium]